MKGELELLWLQKRNQIQRAEMHAERIQREQIQAQKVQGGQIQKTKRRTMHLQEK